MYEECRRVMYGGKLVNTSNIGHLDKLTESLEETLRIESFPYFITSVLPDFEMNWHHLEWSDIPMNWNRFCVIASRDHGKSYMFSYALPAWKMYGYQPNNTTKQNLLRRAGFIFSFSAEQARELLTILKEQIENNPILSKKLLPRSNEGWAAESIVCRNGAKLKVKGFGSSVRGAHPGYIIVDDGLKDNVIYSSVQRKKNTDYFHSVIMNMIVPDGMVGVVGTPFHQTDLYGDLKTKKGWHVREYPGIFPDGTMLWPNRWSFEGLMDKRETQGSLSFSREILCRPITNDSTIFPDEIIQKAFVRMDQYTLVQSRDNFPVKFNKVVCGCDFAISSSIGADYSVFITLGVEDDGTCWLLNMKRFKGKSFGEQIAILKGLHANFRYDVMMLEKNQFQTIFAEEAIKQGLPVVPHQTSTNKYDFKTGLPGLALLFERGRIKIPRGNQESVDTADQIQLELSSITWTEEHGLAGTSEHDDIGMALWIASLGAQKVNFETFRITLL
jgi:hypothetical protein